MSTQPLEILIKLQRYHEYLSQLFKEQFPKKIDQWIGVLENEMKESGLDSIKAMMKLCDEITDPEKKDVVVPWFAAAIVEMNRRSVVQSTIKEVDKIIKRKRKCTT